jgi:hypothetical protein
VSSGDETFQTLQLERYIVTTVTHVLRTRLVLLEELEVIFVLNALTTKMNMKFLIEEAHYCNALSGHI